MVTVFFDSWGGAHVECDPHHPDAGAFGPTGVSRPLTEGELLAAGLAAEGVTALSVATKLASVGMGSPVLTEGEWLTVMVHTID